MAASREWTEWHLTQKGWIKGTQRRDFASTLTIPAPEGRVLTYRYTETHSGYGKATGHLTEEWRSESIEKVQALLHEYGECPKSL